MPSLRPGILLLVLPLTSGFKMANSHGQRLPHSAAATGRTLAEDCSGQGITWGPDIGPPPSGCEDMISDGASPPTTGGGGSSGVGGETASDMCPQDEDTCNTDGSTNFIYRDELTYKATDGKFYGTLITNQCNDHVRESLDGTAMPGNNAVSCIDQTIPAPDVTPVSPIPLLGRAALTLSGGVNIYSAFEAGFNDCAIDGMPCACDGASCAAGMDVGSCEAHLHFSCTGDVAVNMFMDTCGGHADPYHIHTDPVCNYVPSPSGHSSLVGVSMDGYGVYGKFETFEQRPCDLDVCHGHVGLIPVEEEYGVYEENTVYHYHVSDADVYPYTWTLGCYGDPETPVDLETCRSLYDGCGGETETIYTDIYPDGYEVELWCPCFDVHKEDGCTYALDETDPTSTCTDSVDCEESTDPYCGYECMDGVCAMWCESAPAPDPLTCMDSYTLWAAASAEGSCPKGMCENYACASALDAALADVDAMVAGLLTCEGDLVEMKMLGELGADFIKINLAGIVAGCGLEDDVAVTFEPGSCAFGASNLMSMDLFCPSTCQKISDGEEERDEGRRECDEGESEYQVADCGMATCETALQKLLVPGVLDDTVAALSTCDGMLEGYKVYGTMGAVFLQMAVLSRLNECGFEGGSSTEELTACMEPCNPGDRRLEEGGVPPCEVVESAIACAVRPDNCGPDNAIVNSILDMYNSCACEQNADACKMMDGGDNDDDCPEGYYRAESTVRKLRRAEKRKAMQRQGKQGRRLFGIEVPEYCKKIQ